MFPTSELKINDINKHIFQATCAYVCKYLQWFIIIYFAKIHKLFWSSSATSNKHHNCDISSNFYLQQKKPLETVKKLFLVNIRKGIESLKISMWLLIMHSYETEELIHKSMRGREEKFRWKHEQQHNKCSSMNTYIEFGSTTAKKSLFCFLIKIICFIWALNEEQLDTSTAKTAHRERERESSMSDSAKFINNEKSVLIKFLQQTASCTHTKKNCVQFVLF